jgi:hypothetical protein
VLGAGRQLKQLVLVDVHCLQGEVQYTVTTIPEVLLAIMAVLYKYLTEKVLEVGEK